MRLYDIINLSKIKIPGANKSVSANEGILRRNIAPDTNDSISYSQEKSNPSGANKLEPKKLRTYSVVDLGAIKIPSADRAATHQKDFHSGDTALGINDSISGPQVKSNSRKPSK